MLTRTSPAEHSLRHSRAHRTLHSPRRYDSRFWTCSENCNFSVRKTVIFSFCPERSRSLYLRSHTVRHPLQLARAHRPICSAPQSDDRFRSCEGFVGQNSGFLAEIPLFAQNGHGSCSHALARLIVLSAIVARIERSLPHAGTTHGSGLAAKTVIFRSEKP